MSPAFSLYTTCLAIGSAYPGTAAPQPHGQTVPPKANTIQREELAQTIRTRFGFYLVSLSPEDLETIISWGKRRLEGAGEGVDKQAAIRTPK